MIRKCVWLSSLVAAVLGFGVARGQGPSYLAGSITDGSTPPVAALPPGPSYTGPHVTHDGNGNGGPWGPTAAVVAPSADGAPATGIAKVSSWIAYPRSPGCCGPLGGDGPIGSELYARSGVSFPVGGPGILGDAFKPGWGIEGGGRVLFFNPAVDSAWVVDLSVSNYHYNATDRAHKATLLNVPTRTTIGGQTVNSTIPSEVVTLTGLNQTFVNGAIGKEWYLVGTGNCNSDAWNWRVGTDLGARWGSAKLDLASLRHRTHTVYGGFFAVHSDVEIPCGSCIFQAGVRAEYGYNKNDLLQGQNETDLQTINLMFTVGARF